MEYFNISDTILILKQQTHQNNTYTTDKNAQKTQQN